MPPTALQPLPDPTWSSRAKSLLNSTTSKTGGRRGSRERERGQTWWTLQKETPWSHYKIGASYPKVVEGCGLMPHRLSRC